MNVLEKQLFEANFTAIAEQFVKWKEAKPDTKILDSLAKCLYEMYTYTNSLEINLMVKDKQLKKFRDENLKLRIDANRD
jgi:hypothetical protein